MQLPKTLLATTATLIAASLLPSAQTLKPPGVFGGELVVEDPGAGISDILTAFLTPTAVPGTVVPPVLAVSLATDLTGDGVPEVVKINGAENGTTWQSPTAPRIVVAIDPVLGTPIIFIPAFAPALGASVISYVDVRFGLPAAVGGVLAAGLVDIPYQMIDDGAGRLYVAESIPGAIGVMTVAEIGFGGGAVPALTAATVVAGLDTERQDQMSLVGGTLQVPHTLGVDLFTTPGLATLGSVPMPTNAFGVPYVPYTNMISGLPGFFDMMLFAGIPGGGVGNTFITWSSATGVAGPTGGIDPGGALLRPAAGFHEPAFTPTGPGTGTVTALLDGLPLGVGLGAIFQVPVTLAGPGVPVVSPVPSPFGNPEASRGPLADPIGFQVSTPAIDFFGAVTAGSFGPIGSVSGLVALVGLVNPADSPRPLSMAFPGLATTDFAVTTSIGAGSVNVLTVGPGPAVTATTAFPAVGGASSLGIVWPAGAPGGPLPAHFQQIAATGVLLQVGAPFSVPPLSLTSLDPVGIPPMGIGPLVAVPAPQPVAASIQASEPSLNFDMVGITGSFVTVHPSPGLPVGVPGTASISKGPSYGFFSATYPGIGSFVSEFASY